MAFPYTVIGPGGQPYIVSQVPIVQQAMAPQLIPTPIIPQPPIPQNVPQPPKPPQKPPDFMTDEKLQEKGRSHTKKRYGHSSKCKQKAYFIYETNKSNDQPLPIVIKRDLAQVHFHSNHHQPRTWIRS